MRLAYRYRYVVTDSRHCCPSIRSYVAPFKGHSYVTYGPMLNAATQVVFEGVPNYPDSGRLWEITDRYKVAILYTAPTAIRALKRAGDEFVTKHSRASLKLLGSVGEPINPEAYMWYYDVVGSGRCPIVDTWWQTETGGFCLTPLPVANLKMKPGSAMMPFFGIEPALLNEEGEELEGVASGYLAIKKPWPSTLRSVYGDHKRMEEVYFSRFPGYYMTGDGARRDEDGHYTLTGRVDGMFY
jgi:acetyl-CoA synthetase